jgi:hypothetical protein
MEELHTSVADLVHARGGRNSTLINEISRHALPTSVGFGALGQLLTLVGEAKPDACVLLGTSSGDLVVSIKSGGNTKKRPRQESDADERAKKSLSGLAGSAVELKGVRAVVSSLFALSGTAGEPVLQGLTVERKSLAGKRRYVLAARLHSGVALPLKNLKDAIGGGWSDGAVTMESSFESIGVTFPALSEEGKAAEEVGGLSCVVVCALAPDGEGVAGA